MSETRYTTGHGPGQASYGTGLSRLRFSRPVSIEPLPDLLGSDSGWCYLRAFSGKQALR